jgi:hypothetical protein
MNLTSKSKKLLLFFSKNKYFFDMNQTIKTNKILLELYSEILKAYHYIKKNQPRILSIKKIVNSIQITKPKNFNAKSFPEIVRNHIDEMIISEICYTFSIYDRQVKVYFMVENDNIELEIDMYNGYVETIAMWLYVLNIYASKQCVKTLSIYLYFTSLEKHLPNSNIYVLDENHVNTAFTTTCPSDSEIIVFRKEEWFKVLIHETFHNFGLDFSGMNNERIYYIQPRPYIHYLNSSTIIERFLSSSIFQNISSAEIQHRITSKIYDNFGNDYKNIITKSQIERDIAISRKMMNYIREFFYLTMKRTKTRRNRSRSIKNITKRKI